MHLFSPLELRGLTLRSRVVVSPMCQYSSEDGMANDWHFVHLGQFAVGRAALVFTEATAVEARGRISPEDLGIWSDKHALALRPIVEFIAKQGGAAGIQLAHAGRKGSTAAPWNGGKKIAPEDGGWTPIAPSAIPFAPDYPMPEELSASEIAKVVDAFAAAAMRALAIGFHVVEIHAAHGYLLHEFCSPISNQRTDGYGGSFENRTRIVCEVVEAVRAKWPAERPLFMRVSATDWVEGGWSLEETVALARRVKPLGVDLVDCSSGGNVVAKIPVGPGYQVPFAERVKREAGVATGAVGVITSPEQADTIVRSGQADVVLIAREMLRDPHFALRAARVLGHDVEWPRQYARAKG